MFNRLTPRRRSTHHAAPRWPWFVPFFVLIFIVGTSGILLQRAVAGLIALIIVVLAARRPDLSLFALIVGLPFQSLVLAQLYTWGVPREIVRPLASWKEALAIGVIAAGVIGYRRGGHRLDRLDALGLVYVAIVGVYALFPQLFSSVAPTAGDARSLAFRASAGFVLLLLGARHARLPTNFMARASQVVLVVGAIVAVVAVYEFFFDESWNRFIVEDVRYTRYQYEVLNVFPFNFSDIRFHGTIGGADFIRVGSVLLSPLTLGFYLLLPFAVAIERTTREGLRSASGAVLLLVGAALIFTQTRAALVGAVIIAFIALRPAAGRSSERRWQFAMLLAVGVILALPVATATELSQRATTAASGDEESATDHVEAFWNGIDAVASRPLGHGVATSAGSGQRFQVEETTITENNYLQVGVEVGLLGMILFVALTVTMLRRLKRATLAVPDPGIAATRGAALGLAVGAFFLHAWAAIPIAWTLWALAGAAIGIAEARVQSDRETSPGSAIPPRIIEVGRSRSID